MVLLLDGAYVVVNKIISRVYGSTRALFKKCHSDVGVGFSKNSRDFGLTSSFYSVPLKIIKNLLTKI